MTSKVLLDTNILLDYTLPDRSFQPQVEQLIDMLVSRKYEMYVTPGSLKDYFYIATKAMDVDMANMFMGEFLRVFHVLTVDENTCRVAHQSAERDFEDALVQAVAELNHMDFIVTRDRTAFTMSTVRAVSPELMMKIAGIDGA